MHTLEQLSYVGGVLALVHSILAQHTCTAHVHKPSDGGSCTPSNQGSPASGVVGVVHKGSLILDQLFVYNNIDCQRIVHSLLRHTSSFQSCVCRTMQCTAVHCSHCTVSLSILR